MADQRTEALRRANSLRSARAQLKQAIKRGDVPVAEILRDPPDYLRVTHSGGKPVTAAQVLGVAAAVVRDTRGAVAGASGSPPERDAPQHFPGKTGDFGGAA